MNASTQVLDQIDEALEAGGMDRFVQELKPLFASIPHPIFMSDKEAYYHSIIYLVLCLNGAAVKAEDHTNIGRIDAVLETRDKIYIMEFNVGVDSEQKALAQIKEIVLMGIGFDPKKRNIGNYLLEAWI